jgi:hypothetical protein
LFGELKLEDKSIYKKMATYIAFILWGFIAVLFIFQEKPQGGDYPDKIYAYTISQNYMLPHLKSPSTAVFCSYKSTAVRMGMKYVEPFKEYVFEVNGCVDSQNAFGATIRTYYTAILKNYAFEDCYSLFGIEYNCKTRAGDWKLLNFELN